MAYHMADHLEIDNCNIKIRTVLTRGEKCVTIRSQKDCQKRIEISLTPEQDIVNGKKTAYPEVAP